MIHPPYRGTDKLSYPVTNFCFQERNERFHSDLYVPRLINKMYGFNTSRETFLDKTDK